MILVQLTTDLTFGWQGQGEAEILNQVSGSIQGELRQTLIFLT